MPLILPPFLPSRSQREAALRQLPGLVRFREAVWAVWAEAMNAAEAGWTPPDPVFWSLLTELGQYLTDTSTLQDEMQAEIQAAIERAIADGRLSPSQVPAGLAALPVALVLGAAAIAAILAGYVGTDFYRRYLEHKRQNEIIREVAAGMRRVLDVALDPSQPPESRAAAERIIEHLSQLPPPPPVTSPFMVAAGLAVAALLLLRRRR